MSRPNLTALTSDDLHSIALAIEQLQSVFLSEDGDYTTAGSLVLRLEITRPDDDSPIGHLTMQDGWMGFTPLHWRDQS